MSEMPKESKCASQSSPPSMGMGQTSLDSHPHRLCWALPWKIVPHHCRFVFKVARCDDSTICYCTSQNTIRRLRSIFATHGLPEILVSDNGTAFTSAEFQEFIRLNGICYITSVPYHPASNGLAERAVQTLKQGLRKSSTVDDMETRVSRFLFRYRTTPHSTTGVSPAELLLG